MPASYVCSRRGYHITVKGTSISRQKEERLRFGRNDDHEFKLKVILDLMLTLTRLRPRHPRKPVEGGYCNSSGQGARGRPLCVRLRQKHRLPATL